MEPALKQRLLGAAVLVALAVIFLPMIFSGAPPKPEQQTVSLDIPPEPDMHMQSRVYELPTGAATAIAPTPAMTTVQVPTTTAIDTIAPTVTISPTESDAKPTAPPTATAKPAVAEPTRPSPEPAPGPATAANVGYLVSLGVYADRGNAQARLADAQKLGFKAYLETVPVNGKPANGVRVGPFAGRASAEAARLKLKDAIAGSNPALVAVEQSTATAKPATAATAAPPGGWAVQLAALRSRSDAVAMRNRVHAAGFEAFVDDTRGKDGTWWRVRVGPRAERAEAEKLAANIKAKLHMTAIVVTHP